MPAVSQTDLNEPITVERRFYDATTGALTDPASCQLLVRNPAGTVTTVAQGALTHPSTGIWRYTLVPGTTPAGTAGVWRYLFDAGVSASEEYEYLLVEAGPRSTLCSTWASVEDLAACPGIPSTASEALLTMGLEAASDLLWRWSGFRYGGLCADSVRPCAQNAYFDPVPSEGYSGVSLGSCACQAAVHRACGCSMLSEVRLGRSPVVAIVEVRQDGAVLAASSYRLDDYEWLVRIDGGSWPCCQDLTKADTVANTWAVDFIWGQNPPPSGRLAAIDLATELVKKCAGGDCAIPEHVSSLVRQGESMIFLPPTMYGRDAQGSIRAGIQSVDYFLTAVGTGRPAMIATVDGSAVARRTSTNLRR